jgi:hypothetical protein
VAGEMCASELQPGGDWYEAGQSLLQAAQALCRRTGWKLRGPELRAYDQYQGPYARFDTGGGRLWLDTNPTGDLNLDEFVLEHSYVGGTLRGTVRELAEAFKCGGKTVRLYDTGTSDTWNLNGLGHILAFNGVRQYAERYEIHESWEEAQRQVLYRLDDEIKKLTEQRDRVLAMTAETCPMGLNPYA